MFNELFYLTPPGNVVEAVRHARTIRREINMARSLSPTELYGYAKELGVPLDLLKKTAELGRLPVVNFAAGGLGECSNIALPHWSILRHIEQSILTAFYLLLQQSGDLIVRTLETSIRIYILNQSIIWDT